MLVAVKYMANNIRPLDYFPFSVRFFEDRKIKRLQRSYKETGLIIYVYLITEIYKNGSYYLEWDSDYPEDIAEAIGAESSEKVEQIIKDCAARFGLFDKDLFEQGILTSKGIQHRILEIKANTWKSKIDINKLFPRYRLIDSENFGKIADNIRELPTTSDIARKLPILPETSNSPNSISVSSPKTSEDYRSEPPKSDNAVICGNLRENAENFGETRPKLNKTKLNETKLNINNTLQISNDGNLQPAAKEQNAEPAEPAEPKTKKFVKPTIEELTGYVMATGLPLNFDDVNEFMDYYTSKGWKVGREGMKDWQAALRNWSRRKGEYSRPNNTRPTETVTITDRQKINEEFLNGK